MIEILYFEGCPNRELTVELAREVIREVGVRAELREIEVRDVADAERLAFLGSPSVRVNGVDVDPDAAGRTDYAFGCRMYGESGVPPREFLVSALRSATGGVVRDE